MAKKQDLLVGLDIGTTEVRVVVGEVDPVDESQISVLGIGRARNGGMRKGVIIHPEEVTAAITAALDEAERVTGRQIDHATINVNGAHVESQLSKGVVAISGNKQITEEDRDRVEDAATVMQLPPNREIIQLFAKDYHIDGQDNIKNPVGMEGVRLEVDALILTGSTPLLRALDNVAQNSQVSVAHKTVSSLASAEAVLDRDARESGSAVIDIGAGTTNIVVMDEGEVEHVAVIPVGGMHITNDLAIGLKIELDTAEKVKREYVDLSRSMTGTKKVTVGREDVQFDLEEVALIVESRIEELCEYINKELEVAGYAGKLPGGVFLTGGTANLKGISQAFKEELKLPARLAGVTGITGIKESVAAAEYRTVVGLMVLDRLLSGTQDTHISGVQLNSLSSRVKSIFKR